MKSLSGLLENNPVHYPRLFHRANCSHSDSPLARLVPALSPQPIAAFVSSLGGFAQAPNSCVNACSCWAACHLNVYIINVEVVRFSREDCARRRRRAAVWPLSRFWGCAIGTPRNWANLPCYLLMKFPPTRTDCWAAASEFGAGTAVDGTRYPSNEYKTIID